MITPNMNTLHGLRHGQAVALQYVVQLLINLKRDPQIARHVLSGSQLAATNAIQTTAVGCHYATGFLLPFVVELALKALVAKHNTDQVAKEHCLSKLYDDLPCNVQDRLKRDFEHIKLSELPHETRALRTVLSDHDNDFPDRRYLDDPQGLVNTPIDTLQYVASSVLNVYNTPT